MATELIALTSSPLLQALVLGIVQGLTEFLPISSSAHLRVVPALLHWQDPGAAYTAVLQLGSVAAVLAYFFRDLVAIAGGSARALSKRDWSNHDLQLAMAMIIGTAPICVAGLLLRHELESQGTALRSLYVVGGASIVMGLLLLVAERLGRRSKGIEEMGVRNGFLIGLAQALALIPGCSRSGTTLTAALLLNLRRDDAARFSFLLGIPAVTLAGLVELLGLVKHGMDGASIDSLLVGLASTFVVSYAAIWWLIKYLRSHSTMVFTIYRVIFGIALIALASAGLIK